ncbi:opioid growth factor receptor-like protein 1 [Microcaecilia unicolor]|uniref:Opioid growth factor receptor-like protein 1 n=1 Tax=Microcaecilia unicolor TaxID=1415580 RepID=A0A6P7XP19_9AMPH|nr:opioid growth factor receptor-like protein 1 [Microcaecilia unicolor]
MGNLLSGTTPKEPTTVEECDSTWETDSGGEPEEEEDQGQTEPEEEEEGRRLEESETGEQQEEQSQGEPSVPCSCQEDDAGTVAAAAAGEEKNEGNGKALEEEVVEAEQSNSVAEQIIKPKRSFYAARDLYKYRHQYPNFKDSRCQNDLWNLRFYLNKIPLKPDGVYIEEILSKWKGDYDKLEHNHTYIQWLFPLREQGLNFYAKELTAYEIEEFKKTKEAIKRFLLAYKMMLEFFGIKLTSKTGNVTRAANWQERFQHLNESQHNYLRITRILKSLGELGYEGFKPSLVKLFLQEALVENTIPNIKQSSLEYFVYTIKNRRERRKLLRFAQRHYKPPEHFIWGPPKKTKPEENNVSKKTVSSSCAHHSPVQMQTRSKDASCISAFVSSDSKNAEPKVGELCDQPRRSSSSEEDKKSINEKKTENENQDSRAEEGNDPPASTEGTTSLPEEEENGGRDNEIMIQGFENPEMVEQDPCHESNKDFSHSLSTTLKMDIQTVELLLPDPDLQSKDGTKS